MKNLWDFHHLAGIGNKEIGLVMDRGFIKTKSITQVKKTSEGIKINYEDLQKGNKIKVQDSMFEIQHIQGVHY